MSCVTNSRSEMTYLLQVRQPVGVVHRHERLGEVLHSPVRDVALQARRQLTRDQLALLQDRPRLGRHGRTQEAWPDLPVTLQQQPLVGRDGGAVACETTT